MVMAVCGGGRWKEGARSRPVDYGGEGKAEEVLRKKSRLNFRGRKVETAKGYIVRDN